MGDVALFGVLTVVLGTRLYGSALAEAESFVGSNPASGFTFPLVDFPYESRCCGPQIRAG